MFIGETASKKDLVRLKTSRHFHAPHLTVVPQGFPELFGSKGGESNMNLQTLALAIHSATTSPGSVGEMPGFCL